jgi:magnesium transporter
VEAREISTWTRSGEHWTPDGDVARTEVVWVRIADRADLTEVGERYGLPADVLRRAGTRSVVSGRSRHHVEHLQGGGVYLTAPTLTYRDVTDDVLTGEVTCLVLDGVVLTAESGDAQTLDRVTERLSQPQVLPDRLTGGVLSALLASLVQGAADVEGSLGDAVTELEGEVFSTARTTPVERIYALKREIAEARRALVPLGAELPELVTEPDDAAAADAWVRRLETAVDRIDHRFDAHDSLLADMLSAHLALVSVQQNDTIRRISAWAAIIAVPTLIASIYGMNFGHMPELSWTWGYPTAVAVMVSLGLVLHRLFRRSGWL